MAKNKKLLEDEMTEEELIETSDEEKETEEELVETSEEPEEEEEEKEEIQDIQLGFNSKKKFRIDNDSSRILELDTSDLSVLSRLEEYYPKLKELEKEVSELSLNKDSDNEVLISKMGRGLAKIDAKMRDYIDTIFNANVSATCAPSGSMYDPINGQFRYEHIISLIIGLYEKSLAKETKKLKSRISKHTQKYTQ